MTRDEARNEIRARYAEYLEPAKKRGTYICPLCGNGTGSTGDGLAVDPHGDRLHLKCFNPRCNFYGDLIELYQQQHGCTQQEAFSGLYSYFNISIDEYTAEPQRRPQRAQEATQEVQYMQEVQKDYTEYFKECKARISDPAAAEYLALRGLSPELAHRFWIGFDPAWRSPAAIERGKNPPSSPRLIIPTSASSYIARDTRPDVKDYAKMKEGEVQLFNTRDLYNADDRPVFITEGEIDALSIIEAGGLATALGSAANYKMLVDLLRDKRTNNTLILSLDNDDAGRKTSRELAAALQGLNISYISADIAAGYKDPNEALNADRTAFFDAVTAAERRTSKPDNTSDYISLFMAGEIEKLKENSNRKTGFSNLDEEAGGVYPGLYAVGGISSVGKTTFIYQMADQMAEAGQHVLFFSMEQSRLEMVSKSIARTTAQTDINTAVSSIAIRTGTFTPAALDAADEYSQTVGGRLSVIEGNFNCTVSFIGEYTRKYIEKNGDKPVVIVDYLQVLRPEKDPETGRKSTDTKQIVDYNITQLKRMSRALDIPVFVISSLNRSNYLTPVDFESFKESGGIEYTADVVWGLQLGAMNDPLFDKDKHIKEKREIVRNAKAETPRKIQLLCLKNRYGISSYTADFLYYPANDYFKPAGQEYANWQPTYPDAEEIERQLEADLEAMIL